MSVFSCYPGMPSTDGMVLYVSQTGYANSGRLWLDCRKIRHFQLMGLCSEPRREHTFSALPIKDRTDLPMDWLEGVTPPKQLLSGARF